MKQLFFAQAFPFSEKSRKTLKEMNVSLENIPKKASEKAMNLILKANSNEIPESKLSPYEEDVAFELMAYPVAKMFISLMNTPNIIEKFCAFIRKKTFQSLIESEKPRDTCFDLADDFALKYDLSEENFFVINVLDYLDIYFTDDETKLVNKRLEQGKVFLSLNDFARFLSEKTYKKVFDSLPIKKESIPKEFVKTAKELDSQLGFVQQKRFDAKISGKIDPNIFPPSMKELYERQLSGKKLSYYERLAIGGFLRQIGMQKIEMLTFFSKSPDYKKHIAEYHINRMFEKELSAPGYKKMDEYGITVFAEEKKFKHPVQYYTSKLRIRNRVDNTKKNNSNTKESKSGGEKNV